MQVVLASGDEKTGELFTLRVSTPDMTPPVFSDVPVAIGVLGTDQDVRFDLRFALSEPGLVHYAVSYRAVSASFRDFDMGYSIAPLSPQQILQASISPGLRSNAVVFAGTAVVDEADIITSIMIQPACINANQCLLHTYALNPDTEYVVRIPGSSFVF